MATVKSRKKKNSARRKSRVLKLLLSIILLAVISATTIVIINNGKLDAEGFKRLFTGSGNTTAASEFSFDAGLDSVFADIDGRLAVCTTVGLQLYDRSAELAFREMFEMSDPTVCTGGKVAAVYDMGGNTLKLFDESGVIKGFTTKGKIISASLSLNGWLVLCTQESGYKGLVSVYNASGSEVYNWYSAKGYVLSAEVSPDNKSLAVLTLNEDGSRIVFFSMDSDDEKASCILHGGLALEIKYISSSSVLAVSADSLTLIQTDGSFVSLIDYPSKYLAGYSIDSDSFSALVLNDYLVGEQGSIVTVDKMGKTLATIQTERKTLSLSANRDYLAVLFSDGLVIYDKYLNECSHFDNTAGAEEVIMRSDGTALSIMAHSACVYETVSD